MAISNKDIENQYPDIVDCTVVGMRESEEPESTETQSAENARNKAVAYVNITLSNGMKVEHRRLSYPELLTFITKLEGAIQVTCL